MLHFLMAYDNESTSLVWYLPCFDTYVQSDFNSFCCFACFVRLVMTCCLLAFVLFFADEE